MKQLNYTERDLSYIVNVFRQNLTLVITVRKQNVNVVSAEGES